MSSDRYLSDGEPVTAFEAVGKYIEKRHGQNVSADKHGYHQTLHQGARRNYKLGKEMDRELLSRYDNPTTVLLSLRVSPDDWGRLTLLVALQKALGAVVTQLRYRLQEAPDAPFSAHQWEYMAVVAGTRRQATPHLHLLVYCDGDVSREVFFPVVEKFIKTCEFAPWDGRGNSVEDGTISIRGNGEDTVPRMDDAPGESLASTYVLTQLPHLRAVDDMALDELLHGSTVDAWGGRCFRKSQYSV